MTRKRLDIGMARKRRCCHTSPLQPVEVVISRKRKAAMLPPDSRVFAVPLNSTPEETSCWEEFMKFNEETPPITIVGYNKIEGSVAYNKIEGYKPFEEMKRPVNLDHPIVPFVGDFAVDAYNELCQMFIKPNVPKNIYDVETMGVRYMRFRKCYVFYIDFEAMEDGIPGAYKAIVCCSTVEPLCKSLLEFARSTCPVVGKKAEEAADYILLESLKGYGDRNAILDGLKEHLEHLEGGKEKAKKDLVNLKERYEGTIDEEERTRMLNQLIFQESDCKALERHSKWLEFLLGVRKRNNPDLWSVSAADPRTGLQMRGEEHLCMGHDYLTPIESLRQIPW